MGFELREFMATAPPPERELPNAPAEISRFKGSKRCSEPEPDTIVNVTLTSLLRPINTLSDTVNALFTRIIVKKSQLEKLLSDYTEVSS